LFDLPFEEPDDSSSSADGLSSSIDRRSPPVSDKRPTTKPASSTIDQRPSTNDQRQVLTVTELTIRVRDALEVQIGEVWVEGELSNCRIWNTGPLYFTLKDSSSQPRGFMFKSALRYLRFKPVDGTRVVARGR